MATSRIAAAGMAALAAVSTAWALGAGVGLTELWTLTAAPLLLLVAVRLGLRARAIFIAAAISGTLVAAIYAAPAALGLPRGGPSGPLAQGLLVASVVTLTAFSPIAWRIHDVRLFGSGVLSGVLTAFMSLTWPVFVAAGASRLVAGGHQRAVLAAVATALLTWAFTAFGRSSASDVGSTLSAARDGTFRVLALLAGAAASLWAGATVEARFAGHAAATPFESLTSTVGWAAAVVAFVPIVLMAWWLPGRLVRAQLRGRIDAQAVGEPLTFLTFAVMAALTLWRLDMTNPLGRACWIALAASGAYTLCRLRYGAPLPEVNAPLWVVVLGSDLRSMDSIISNIADVWRAGQITVLAAPSAASEIGGEHLHAAVRAGQGAALFPQRLAHLQDWDDAQPALWSAMPVRELYAVPELWPTILSERLGASARVIALIKEEPPADDAAGSLTNRTSTTVRLEELQWSRDDPFGQFRRWGNGVVSRLRRAAGIRRRLASFIPPSRAASLSPDLLPADVARLADGVVDDEASLKERLRAVLPAPVPIAVRHIIIQSAPGELEFADKLAQRLYGVRDPEGRVIESWVSTALGSPAALRRLVTTPLGAWRYATIFLARMIDSSVSRGGNAVTLGLLRVAAALLERQWNGEFDVVVVEGGEGGSRHGLPAQVIEAGRNRGIVAQVVAVRTAAAEAAGALSYAPSLYSGQVRVPAGRSTDVAVTAVAEKLLGRDLLTLQAPDVSSTPETWRVAGWRRLVMAAIAASVVAGGLYFIDRTADESQRPATATGLPIGPSGGTQRPIAPAPPVDVSLDALPWARFTVRPATQDSRQVVVQGITPARLQLLPGEYVVELENGGLTAALRERLVVGAEPLQKAFVMPGFDAERAASQLLDGQQ